MIKGNVLSHATEKRAATTTKVKKLNVSENIFLANNNNSVYNIYAWLSRDCIVLHIIMITVLH